MRSADLSPTSAFRESWPDPNLTQKRFRWLWASPHCLPGAIREDARGRRLSGVSLPTGPSRNLCLDESDLGFAA